MAAVLTSWKEIAAHLGKSIRTVQRWERDLGLPVRRPDARRSGIVLADPAELDAWLHHQSTLGALPEAENGQGNGVSASHTSALHCECLRVSSLQVRTNELMRQTQKLYEQLSDSVSRLHVVLAASRELSAGKRHLSTARVPQSN